MKPINSNVKNSNGFSIESLIRTDNNKETSSSSASQCEPEQNTSVIPGRIPPLHPALPPHVRNLLLADQVAQHTNHTDLLNFQRSAAWAFQNGPLPSVASFSRGLPTPTAMPLHPTYPNFLPTHRDPMSLYPWLMSRSNNNIFGLPYGKFCRYYNFMNCVSWERKLKLTDSMNKKYIEICNIYDKITYLL